MSKMGLKAMSDETDDAGCMVIPRAAVSAAIFCKDRVLLVKRARDPAKGLWSLPGGHICTGEAAEDAIKRELREETGIEAKLFGPVAVKDVVQQNDRGEVIFHRVIIVYCGVMSGGRVRASSDAADATWYGLAEIERLDVTDGLPVIVAGAADRLKVLSVQT
jgi:ADP-ribose pyrophosphatase YjhB (NUDIX family)